METTITAYKVVIEREPGKLTSSAVNRWHCVQYTPGEWAEAPIPGSGLFVFDTLEHAREYTRGDKDFYQTWKCECEEPVTPPNTDNIIPLLYADFQSFWEGGSFDKDFRISVPGTLFFKRVKLLERVK